MKCEKCGYTQITEEMNFCPHCGSSLLPDIKISDEVKKAIVAAVDSAEALTLEALASKVSCDREVVFVALRGIKQRSEWRVSRCKVMLGDSLPEAEETDEKKPKGKKDSKKKSTDFNEVTYAQKKIIYAISHYTEAEFTGKTRKEASDYIDKYRHLLPPRE